MRPDAALLPSGVPLHGVSKHAGNFSDRRGALSQANLSLGFPSKLGLPEQIFRGLLGKEPGNTVRERGGRGAERPGRPSPVNGEPAGQPTGFQGLLSNNVAGQLVAH
jgi:hypothetical protein